MSDDNFEFDDIPGMPSDDDLRSRILSTADPEYWNPFGEGPRDSEDLKGLSPRAAEAVREARLATGPGPNGNEYQHAIHEQYRLVNELSSEFERIETQLNEVRSYDPETGEAIQQIQSPDKRRAMEIRQSEIIR